MKQPHLRLLCGAACVALIAAGCGSEVPDKPVATLTPVPGKTVDAATAGAITGQVKFEGVVPPADIIRMTTDKKCLTDAGPNPQSDALLVAADKSVANTFVYVKEGDVWRRREVELGLTSNIDAAVRSGLKPGEVVALEPPPRVAGA